MHSLLLSSYIIVLMILSLAILSESSTIEEPIVHARKLSITPKIKVEMFNKLPDGATLTIHCKSKNDDLGKHIIGAGQSYTFHFRLNVFGSSLFFCGVSWKGGNLVFDIYNGKRDEDPSFRCHYCQWEARKEGIFGFKENEKTMYDLYLPWKH